MALATGTHVEWGHFDASGKFWIDGHGRVGALKKGDVPADAAVYRCVGRLKAGATRSNENVEAVEVLVIDDVGTRISQEAMELLAPAPTFIIETSAGNHQWQYVISGGMPVADYVALRASMRSHPVWGKSHATAPSNLVRLPWGVNGKPGHEAFLVGEVGGTGVERTAAVTIAAFGGIHPGIVTAIGGGADRAPSAACLSAVLGRLPNDGASAYCDSYDAWIEFGLALWGASGGTALAEWEAWCAVQPQPGADPAEKWKSFSGTKIGWGFLSMLEDLHGQGSRAPLAAALFDDGVGTDAGSEAATVPMFTVDDFRSVVGEAEFIHVGTGKFWKPASVDAKVPAVARGQGTIKATAWMRAHRYVTELSWLPGRERIVENASMGSSGMERRLMHSIFNLYQAPVRRRVAGPVDAGPWLGLVRRLWPLEADDILRWFAHRVQRSGEKCNHALVLGGAPGIGKDTVLEGVRRAVGEANCCNILPNDLRASFNDYVKSVLLVVNELRDDGAMSQYAFYDKSKTLIAAPPSTMTINSKYLKTYTVPNVCGVVMTTNYKQTGMYLPADDRRHLVCWSEADAIAEGDTEFPAIWAWMNSGGFDHIAEWLWTLDLSGFDPKAPPRKTQAFLDIVAAAGSSEERALLDKIEALGKPKILRIADLKSGASGAFDEDAAGLDAWLADPKYRKVVAEALDRRGYRQLRNSGQQDGRWKVGRKNEFVYGRKDVDVRELRALAGKLSNINEEGGGAA